MHKPVLLQEVLRYLDPQPDKNFIDATIGDGGHARAILERTSPNGRILGIDRDSEQIRKLRGRFTAYGLQGRANLVCNTFANLADIVKEYNFRPVHGVLFDFGMSSWHLEESKRGFSFREDELLDMRYNVSSGKTAADLVNTFSEQELEQVLREYGEERFAKKIAVNIIETRRARPIKTTFQLVDIIKKATPKWYHRLRIHPATKTFQALRIAVNDELEHIKTALPQVAELLEPGGRIVCISFHSLEDRIVKNFFAEQKKRGKLNILTKKPLVASEEERTKNPRARSAKLRAIRKL